MSERPNSTKDSIGVILLIFGVSLLAAQFLMWFIFPASKILPSLVQDFAAVRAERNAFAAEFDAVDEEMKTVVAQAVNAAKTAQAGVSQDSALREDMESTISVQPFFVFNPFVRLEFNVLSVLRIVCSVVAFILLGVGIYILGTRKAAN